MSSNEMYQLSLSDYTFFIRLRKTYQTETLDSLNLDR